MRDEKVLLIKRETLKNLAIEEQFAAASRLTFSSGSDQKLQYIGKRVIGSKFETQRREDLSQ
jgi:hypothetical protein